MSFFDRCGRNIFALDQQKTITIYLFICMALLFAMRSSFSLAIIEANSSKNVIRRDPPKKYCPGEYKSFANETANQVDWTEFQIGILFATFFIGYGIGSIISAITTMATGPKYTLFVSIFGSSLLNICLPIAILKSIYIVSLFIQFMMGLCQGMKYPAVVDLIVNWVPQEDLSRSIRFIFFGVLIGFTFGPILTSVAIQFTHNWTYIFYYFGAIGVIFSILFMIFCYNDPEKHPFISAKEKEHLSKSLSMNTRYKFNRLSNIPWRRELFKTKTLALIPAQYGHDFVFISFCTYIPKYLANVLHLTLFQITLYISLVYFSVFVVGAVTRLSVKHVEEQSLKIIFNVSAYIPSILFVAGTYFECNLVVTITCFTIGISMCGFCHPDIRVKIFDISETYACLIIAVLNLITCLCSATWFILFGYVVESNSPTEWQVIAMISFILLNSTTTIYEIWSSVKTEMFQPDNFFKIQNTIFQQSLERQEYEA